MSEQQKHYGLRLLSLDGGGIRGLSELLILQEIMNRIQSQEELEDTPLPCKYFDLIGGTSTGGIIALMLGRLRMSVAEAIECYNTLSKTVFSNKKQIFGDGKFKAGELERVIKQIVKDRTGNSEERMLDTRSESDVCKTFVCAMAALNMSAGVPHLFRTYRAPKNQTFNCAVWEAARATSAAPTFFKRIEIGSPGSRQAYVDGGMGRNNPIAQVLEEAETIFPGRSVSCIISIGTGHPRAISIPPPTLLQKVFPLNVLQAIKGIATDCERSAEAMARRFEKTSNVYFRFNVAEGLQNIGLNKWEKLDEVKAHTEQYIRTGKVDQELTAGVTAMRNRQKFVPTTHITGKVQTSTHQLPSLKSCPPPTSVFTGRQQILEKMREFFFDDVGKQHIFVLYGLGGAGKSQIAFKFIETCQIETAARRSRFSDIFFVDASTAETLSCDLKNIALSKGIGDRTQDTLDWFAMKDREWLLFFDNADDITLNLRDYFPRCSHGNILITSRNRDTLLHASSPRSNCQVSGMETDDAKNLLLNVAGLHEENVDEKMTALAVTIVKELGHLALAVVQAGAYIFSTQCGLSRYLAIYQERRDDLLKNFHDNVQKIDHYEKAVYTTWKISFDKLSSEAARFLQLCAFLHNEGISEAIFRNAASNIMTYVPVIPINEQESEILNKAKDLMGIFRSPGMSWDVLKFFKVTTEIRAYSLMEFDEINRMYSIHPLVHAWTRTTISEGEMIRSCVQFALGVSITRTFDSDGYAFRRALVPHLDMALQHDSTKILSVFAEFGLVYSEAGRWKEAEDLQREVKKARLELLGEEHLDTLASMLDLAVTYRKKGRWKEAEMLAHLVRMASRRLGTEHPDTLAFMGGLENLAVTYGERSSLYLAQDLLLQVKEARLRLLGTEHPDTLIAMTNLADTYSNQGRLEEAEGLQVHVKEISLRLLGLEHPGTLTSMADLAVTYRKQGRWKDAENLQIQVTDIRSRLLGAEHPDTLTSIAHLAVTYWSQERWEEAEVLEVQVKETRLRLLGAEHPDTLTSMANLAVTYSSQGRWKEVEELLLQVKEARLRLFGEDHPDTLMTMANLAVTYSSQGRWKEAQELQVQVKEMRCLVLGSFHPDTLETMVDLAATYWQQGQWEEAEKLLKIRSNFV